MNARIPICAARPLVELNSTLLQFCLFIKGIPTEINEVVAEVTWEFTSNIVSHDGNLKDTNEERNLDKSKLLGPCPRQQIQQEYPRIWFHHTR